MSKIDLWMAVKLAHNKAFNFMESVYVCVCNQVGATE